MNVYGIVIKVFFVNIMKYLQIFICLYLGCYSFSKDLDIQFVIGCLDEVLYCFNSLINYVNGKIEVEKV